jgi:hypothetical protein
MGYTVLNTQNQEDYCIIQEGGLFKMNARHSLRIDMDPPRHRNVVGYEYQDSQGVTRTFQAELPKNWFGING